MPAHHLPRFLVLTALLLSGTARAAEGLLPADRPLPEVIDHYIDQKLAQAKVTPAAQADDPTLARRLYLDLAGRIPTAAEARAYASSREPKKREQLIEKLMTSPEHARHDALEFDRFLRNENPEAPSVRRYLLSAFRENRPWDRMFRDLLGTTSDPTQPQQFVIGRLKDLDALTRDVSSVFFGLNISCAQCHRHPHIRALTQDYYYGMKAFFSQSHDFHGTLLDRQHVKPVQFLARGGKGLAARFLFLDGKTVEPPAEKVADLDKAIEEENKRLQEFRTAYPKSKALPPAPPFSPRARLVELALAPESRDLFARSLVNRLWHRFHGYGLVMRIDQMHGGNAASHPELLQWLSRDFIAHEYDLSRLIRGLVSSKTYSRASRWDKPDSPAPELFAVARLRPLTLMQWGVSHRIASDPAALKDWQTVDPGSKQFDLVETQVEKTFGKLIEQPRDNMQISISEAMKLSNDPELLKITGDKLISVLQKVPGRKQQVEEAVWTVLSRPPTSEEHALLSGFLDKRENPSSTGLQQVVWTLFNSPEFRFNH